MKNKTLMLYAFIIMLCFCFAQCKKTNTPDQGEQLPPETHTGAFTFGCKVDGKIYTSKGKGGLLANQYVNFNYLVDSTINILVGNSESKFNLYIKMKYRGNLGQHTTLGYYRGGQFFDNSNGTISNSSNTCYTNDTLIGRINIKYFSPNNILAGTFEMDAINDNGRIIRITEGRFDIGQ